jgi:enoyl-CoA hydratase/carnithine racemase
VAYTDIIYDKPEDGIARVTLNRPKSLNAMTANLISEVYAAADDAIADDSIVVVIYRGAGKSFCAGKDWKDNSSLGDAEWRKNWHGWSLHTWLSPKLSIAQVQGYAIGGGEYLAALCDITVATPDAKFGHPQTRIYGSLGGAFHWNYLMGPKKTKEKILTGRYVTGAEGMTFGLVNQVAPLEELDETALSIARDIVQSERNNPGFVQATKGEINQANPELFIAALQHSVMGTHRAEAKIVQNRLKSADKFRKEVSEKGLHSGLDQVSSGYSS